MNDCRDVIEHYEYQVQCLEDRIEKLEAALQRANANVEEYERKFYLGTDRIEKLEAALRAIIVHCEVPAPPNAEALIMFARKALEGKDE